MELRKNLDRDGRDAGAATITYPSCTSATTRPGALDDLADPDHARVRQPRNPTSDTCNICHSLREHIVASSCVRLTGGTAWKRVQQVPMSSSRAK